MLGKSVINNISNRYDEDIWHQVPSRKLYNQCRNKVGLVVMDKIDFYYNIHDVVRDSDGMYRVPR